MTRTSQDEPVREGLVRAHGADLHRLAAVLTADTWDATHLAARTLADEAGRPHGRPGDGGTATAARLRTSLVRHYLRSAPRRAEVLRTPGGDAGDVLRGLSPRARAACALRLVEGWGAAETAAALRLPARRAESLVPRTPGLDRALTALADRHALTGRDAVDAVMGALPDRATAPADAHGRGWWGWSAAAVLAVALVLGYVVDAQRDAGSARADTPVPATAQDLTAAGWTLDDDGDPPRGAMGLLFRGTVSVDKDRRARAVSIPEAGHFGFAAFGVLWCDMPPAEDDHLQVPAGILTVDGTRIDLPCAGRDGTPPVSQVVALPPGRTGQLEVTGDVPGDGGAILALYTEGDHVEAPVSRDVDVAPPPVAEGASVLDADTGQETSMQTRRAVQALSVGHDSTIQVWSGRTGLVSVLVDGTSVTDDGDIAAMTAMFAAMSEEEASGAELLAPDPADHGDWATQQPDLRDGQWVVHAPGAMRTFSLPADVAPPPGERRTVVVEVVTPTHHEEVQVRVTDAEPVPVDTGPVRADTPARAAAAGDAPELVLGHRLVGRWQVPSDGHLRELQLAGSTPVPDDVLLLGVREGASEPWFGSGEGLMTRGGTLDPLWMQHDLGAALLALDSPWYDSLAGRPGPLRVAAPAAPGQPPATLLAYAPVPYEEYDFDAAQPRPEAPDWAWGADLTQGYLLQAEIGPEDLEDGTVTVPVSDGTAVAARITTEGKGRIRFLVDRQPVGALMATDGWWSSWTAEQVTSEVHVIDPTFPRRQVQLTVVVEDYEDFTIEVLSG